MPQAQGQAAASDGTVCDCEGCLLNAAEPKPFHPQEPAVLSTLERGGRKFRSVWYNQHKWVTLCVKQRKVFCSYCRFATSRKLITFANRGDAAFVSVGFDNFKKGPEKFAAHDASACHREAVAKCSLITAPSILTVANTQLRKQQEVRRAGLLRQITAMKFLLRQGLALRGHSDTEGNLYQLMRTWSADSEVVASWLKAGRFMSADHVNELITLMGHHVLRAVLRRVQSGEPAWFAIIADEATDVTCAEQMNISVRCVDRQYAVHEDSIGLFKLPQTDAGSIASAIKDVLIRTCLPLSLCRGQAYDGAAAMQGKRSGVATRLRNEEPAALPVHCLAHSLNLCLQGAGKKITVIRDAMEVVREIVKLINYSPKRKTLFSSLLTENDQAGGTIKPLCPTRWTVRTAALDSVLSQYTVLMETMEEVNRTTRDEYGMKAGGVLSILEKFSTLFGLRLGHLLFSAAEETSKSLQAKNTTVQEAMRSVQVLRSYFQRQRNDAAFDSFYSATVAMAEELEISKPELPRYRRQPRRLDDGEEPHRFTSPKEYFRPLYHEACDLLLGELNSRFDQEFMKPLQAMESVLINAANGNPFADDLDMLSSSVFGKDLDFAKLARHLAVLPDIVSQALPEVKKVTSIRTVCEAMATGAHRATFSEMDKLLRLYLTVPITSATSERAFSTLRRLLTYLRSTMTEKRLNNCCLLHIHKDVVDEMPLQPTATEFIMANDERRDYFGTPQ